ncbi:MAG TPA: GatB/YqeY domain-containing protein [Patescibacteria group bacterium]|nr:GatB/YqeY domain-containing protein [Patescibacteria group bacterium]
MLEDKLEQDIKSALLAKDTLKLTTLRGLKAVILNEKVAKNKRESGLSDDEVIVLLSKEAKKRQESADLYLQGNNKEKADLELKEKTFIEDYLPEQMSREEISNLVDKIINENNYSGLNNLGPVIAKVKSSAGPGADGSLIAQIAKVKLS